MRPSALSDSAWHCERCDQRKQRRAELEARAVARQAMLHQRLKKRALDKAARCDVHMHVYVYVNDTDRQDYHIGG